MGPRCPRVRLRKALGYRSMAGLLRTLPDVVEVPSGGENKPGRFFWCYFF